ncbi:hypothetical protein [Sinorhizobium mexicanum]|uniref:hypothetical protein n=1 Tax=Sinorhizobium mexicanum TaxID=375549 RepID=UPI0015E02671|nr:hypothetical protein [Sinorhizobium mexicanum]MBP1886601.1 hypothetical protein [Sinorhizobium mexicanum]
MPTSNPIREVFSKRRKPPADVPHVGEAANDNAPFLAKQQSSSCPRLHNLPTL